MGNTEKLLNQIMELKFTSKSLQRQAKKCEKEEKSEKLKIKKAMEKGNIDGARIYAENAIRKRTAQMNYLRLASRLDAVVARLDMQAKMSTISKFQNCGLIFFTKKLCLVAGKTMEKKKTIAAAMAGLRKSGAWRGVGEERDLEKILFRSGGFTEKRLTIFEFEHVKF